MGTAENMRARAIARLRSAMVYWVATTRPDGRPHTMPVWGVWLGEAFWFGTTGQKALNLQHLPYAVVHVESGEDVAIAEGPVEQVPFATAPEAVSAAFRDKYVDPETGEPFELMAGQPPPGAGLYVVRLNVGHAWVEGAFVDTQARWTADARS